MSDPFHRRRASRAIRRALVAGLVALITGAFAPSADAALSGHDWLTMRNRGPQIDVEALAAERRAELEAQESGFVDLLWRFDLSREGNVFVERVRHVRLFLDTDGIERGGELEIAVAPSHESLEISSAYSIPADGRLRRVEPVMVQVTDASSPGIFTDVQNVTVPCPALTAGAVCAIDYTLRFRQRDFPLPWAFSVGLEASNPIERIEIVATGLQDGFAWRATDEALACDEASSTLRCEKVRAKTLPPDVDLSLVADGVPAFVLGSDLDWSGIADRVRKIVEDEIGKGLPTGTARRLLDRAGIDDDPDAIWDELFRFAADDVRYLGFEQGRNAVVPHPPAMTLERRFGDCKDKVTLLVALARQAGLRAFPLLLATGRYSTETIPLPSSAYFDHMVVCFEPEDGALRCADPTVTNTLADDSALAIGGRLALPLRADTTAPELMKSPEFASRIEIENDTTVACDGGVSTQTARSLSGAAKMRFRAGYSNMDPAVRRRFLVEEHQQVTRSALDAEVRLEAFHDRRRPIRVEADLEAPAGNGLAKDHLQVNFEPWLVHYANNYRATNINYPVRVAGLEVVSRHTFSTCDESFIRYHGPALDMQTEFGHLEREYTKGNHGILVETRLRFPSRIISVDQFERVNHFLDNALAQTTIWFELHRRE